MAGVTFDSVADRISSFLLYPNQESSPTSRALAWITTVVVGVLSVGVLHIACAWYRHVRHLPVPTGTAAKAHGVAQQQFHPIDPAKIRTAADRDHFVWFYKPDSNPLTACFGNFYESPRRVFGHKTAEGAFQAWKWGYTSQDRDNPFLDLTGEEAFQLNRQLDEASQKAGGKGTITVHLPNGRIITRNASPASVQTQDGQKLPWYKGGRDYAMMVILDEKFKAGTPEAKALLATGDAWLVEHRTTKKGQGDDYWGDNYNGSGGSNMLGIDLMRQRKQLGGAGEVGFPQQAVGQWFAAGCPKTVV